MVKQIEDNYEAKCEKMIRYLKKERELLKKLVRVQVRHIPRTENSRADALSKLATAPQEYLDIRVSVEHLMEPLVDVNSDEVLPVMTAPISNSVLGLLYGHGILTIYENLLL